ncbi:hypothetical protein L596_012451 [Steinernema carpocapsae]|uniref:Uncharacterized protein n=1 Tax=Steinernema carpocapsae TaxID=34508 RepID=A0A4V6XWF2_STECR|nr:hypothetical protein L596_012451 [Steinernema carpocapsae]
MSSGAWEEAFLVPGSGRDTRFRLQRNEFSVWNFRRKFLIFKFRIRQSTKGSLSGTEFSGFWWGEKVECSVWVGCEEWKAADVQDDGGRKPP